MAQRTWTLFMLCVQAVAWASAGDPPGHLQPLGSHRLPEGEIDVMDGFPNPQEFFEQYVIGEDGSKPVLFRGAATDIPAFKLWNDEYLAHTYGKLLVETELGKKENRSQQMEQMPMTQFLHEYKKREIYMVQDIHPEMKADLTLPRPLQCGGFQKALSMAIMWFSSGGTKSVLHNDDVDNINCIFAGEKDMVMIDKSFKEQVERDHFVKRRGFSRVDVDRVDMYKFPGLGEVPWWTAHMSTGDCLFIPSRWYHTVDSSKTRNLAVNLWFRHLTWFDQEDCEKTEVTDHKPLNDYEIGGLDDIDIEGAREMVFDGLQDVNEITLEDLLAAWGDEVVKQMDIAAVQEMFEALDDNKDMLLTWEEIYRSDMSSLLREFDHVLGPLFDYRGDEEEEEEDEEEGGVYGGKDEL